MEGGSSERQSKLLCSTWSSFPLNRVFFPRSSTGSSFPETQHGLLSPPLNRVFFSSFPKTQQGLLFRASALRSSQRSWNAQFFVPNCERFFFLIWKFWKWWKWFLKKKLNKKKSSQHFCFFSNFLFFQIPFFSKFCVFQIFFFCTI